MTRTPGEITSCSGSSCHTGLTHLGRAKPKCRGDSRIASTFSANSQNLRNSYHKKADLSRSAANYLKDLKDIESMVGLVQRRSPVGFG